MYRERLNNTKSRKNDRHMSRGKKINNDGQLFLVR